ncbi:hypothetical protein V1282_005661 [Nitrobacteraceae bacterium AZCC 2146]
MDIRSRVSTFGCPDLYFPDQLFGHMIPFKERLYIGETHRNAASTDDADVGIKNTSLVVLIEENGNTSDCKIAPTAGEFLEGPAPGLGPRWEAHFSYYFVRLEHCLKRSRKEITSPDEPAAARSRYGNLTITNDRNARHFRGRICVGEAPADRPASPDLIMRYVGDHTLKKGMTGAKACISFDVAPSNARTDPQSICSNFDFTEPLYPLDIDEQGRICQSERENRKQTLSAR